MLNRQIESYNALGQRVAAISNAVDFLLQFPPIAFVDQGIFQVKLGEVVKDRELTSLEFCLST